MHLHPCDEGAYGAAVDRRGHQLTPGQRAEAVRRMMDSTRGRGTADVDTLAETMAQRVLASGAYDDPVATSGQTGMPRLDPTARKALARRLDARAVEILGGCGVPHYVASVEGRRLAAEYVGRTAPAPEVIDEMVQVLIPAAKVTGAMRAHATQAGLARPRSLPPADVVTAWKAGDKGPALAWTKALHDDVIRDIVGAGGGDRLVRLLDRGDGQLARIVAAVRKRTYADEEEGARMAFEAYDATRPVADELATRYVDLKLEGFGVVAPSETSRSAEDTPAPPVAELCRTILSSRAPEMAEVLVRHAVRLVEDAVAAGHADAGDVPFLVSTLIETDRDDMELPTPEAVKADRKVRRKMERDAAYAWAVLRVRPTYTSEQIGATIERMTSRGQVPDHHGGGRERWMAAVVAEAVERVDRGDLGSASVRARSAARFPVPPVLRTVREMLAARPQATALPRHELFGTILRIVDSLPPEAAEGQCAAAVERTMSDMAAREGIRVLAVTHMYDVLPLPEPPHGVLEAWSGGDRAPATAWLRSVNRETMSTRLAQGGEPMRVDALARRVEGADDEVVPILEHLTRTLQGPPVDKAMALFVSFPETEDRAHLLGTAYDALREARQVRLDEERRLADANRKAAEQARRRAEQEARDRRKNDAPVIKAKLPEMMGATKAEVERWIADGRVPTYGRVGFRKWGQHLETTEHSTSVVLALVAEIPAWREADAAATRARRSAASKATAGDRAEKAAATRLRNAVTNFRSRLATSAGVSSYRDGDDGDMIVLGIEVEGPVEAPDMFEPFRVLACSAWPEGLTGRTADGKAIPAKVRRPLVDHVRRLADALRDDMGTAAARAVEAGLASARQAGFASDDAQVARLGAHVTAATAGLRRADVSYSASAHLENALRDAFAEALKVLAKERADREVRGRGGLDDYTGLFPAARGIRRRIVLHIGPTNSGKTHAAMEDLVAASSGTYLSPLRLMALEAHDRLTERGLPARMVTGEETIGPEDAAHVASTIEMTDLDRVVDVAVVDEAQMIFDPSRGWAWTQAIVGVPAHTVHVTGSPDCLAHVTRIAALTKDELEVVAHERLTPLAAVTPPVEDVGPGDAIIAFSRSDVMRIRESLRKDHEVATIYGALGPEVRRSEARRFRSGEATVLVATDAVAMGLNLPIRRIVFHRLTKYDGKQNRRLTGSEIRQIAGRAGRHGFADAGIAGVLAGHLGGECADGSPVRWALEAAPVPPTDLRLPVMPPWRAVSAVADRDGHDDLVRILSEVARLLAADPLLVTADLEEVLQIARTVSRSGLGLRERFGYLGVPVDLRSPVAVSELEGWAKAHGKGDAATPPTCARHDVPTTQAALMSCEDVAKRLSTYLWLAERWPATYAEGERARTSRETVNGLIERALASKALKRTCSQCGGTLHASHRFPICDPCHRGNRQDRYDRYDDNYDDGRYHPRHRW